METNPLTKILNRRIRISFSIEGLLLCILLVFSFTYLIWEIYWYRKVGLAAIKWHTHIMLYFFLLMPFLLLRNRTAKNKKWLGYIFSVWLAFFFTEILLLLFGVFETYAEKNGDGYQSPYQPSLSYYHVGSKELVISRDEYTFQYPLNTLGFPDREWGHTKASAAQKRIISLGDSFTFGDGAAYGESYVSNLDKLLNQGLPKKPDAYYLMNAGFCGSDPFYNYVNLRDRLLCYRPDMVIQMVSSYDMLDDYATRGGMERFLPTGKVKYRAAPWWEPLWAISSVVRIAGMVGVEPMKKTPVKEAQDALVGLFVEYVRFCKENDIILLLVIRPDKHEWRNHRYDLDFAPLQNYLATQENVYVLDLLPYYKQYVTDARNEMKNYFWEKDGHHNREGYKMMAEGIYAASYPILDSLQNIELGGN